MLIRYDDKYVRRLLGLKDALMNFTLFVDAVLQCEGIVVDA